METNPFETKRLHAQIEGYVQGVGFRYFTLEQARRLGLTGWVRNLPNGRVEVSAEGSQQDLEEFLRKLYEGPSGAYVRDIRYEYLPPTGEDYSFRVTF